jgi:hypothetical protein
MASRRLSSMTRTDDSQRSCSPSQTTESTASSFMRTSGACVTWGRDAVCRDPDSTFSANIRIDGFGVAGKDTHLLMPETGLEPL